MNLQYKIEKSGRLVNVELLSGRTAVVSSPAAFINEFKKQSTIESISYEDDVCFKLNQELEFKLGAINSKFNIKQIDKNTIPGRYYLSCSRINLNSWFILPLLSSDIRQNRSWFGWNTFMTQSYLHESLKRIILLYRYFPTMYYTDQEAKLCAHDTFLELSDPNTYSVAYTFCIKEQHFNDVELFTQGKYSSMGDIAKRKIVSFHGDSSNKEKLKDILNKSETRKRELENKLGMILPDDIDLHEKPNLEMEIWK